MTFIQTSSLQAARSQSTLILYGLADIPQIMAFQDEIHDALAPDQKSFYFKKSESTLSAMFNAGSHAIGLTSNGKTLGQALLVFPSSAYPNTGMTDMEPVTPLESISVLQGLGVHPSARGLGIGEKLIRHWIALSKSAGKTNLLAETAQDNPYSWRLFLKNGVGIASEGLDSSDGTKLFNHHKILA